MQPKVHDIRRICIGRQNLEPGNAKKKNPLVVLPLQTSCYSGTALRDAPVGAELVVEVLFCSLYLLGQKIVSKGKFY